MEDAEVVLNKCFTEYIKTMGIKSVIISLLVTVPQFCFSQNPIIRNQFAGEPTARVFNNRVYLYPSHDIIPPAGQRQDWFCMEDYHVFSSENLTDWTDHGVIVTQNKVPWVKPNSYSMWAPDCVYRRGKYYFYFPSSPTKGAGFGIGVAVADSPIGPFVPEPEPIKGINGIDPCVLVASDGNAYIFWGAGRCAKLKDNMKEVADDTPIEKTKWGNRIIETPGYNLLKNLPNKQAEGPFAFEYNGYYYLSYSYVRDDTEVLGYAMSKNPMGPYIYKGLIMAEHEDGCWTNHHSIVNYKGQWYLFYHHNTLSPNDDKRRSVCVEKLTFNTDGTIQQVKPTMRGVGINQAIEKIEIARFNTASNNVVSQLIDVQQPFGGFQAKLPFKGSWLKYCDVDFSNLGEGYLTVCVKANTNTTLCVREKSNTGRVIAKIDLTTNNNQEAGKWLTLDTPLEYTPKGVTDLVVTAEGDGFDIEWIKFNKGKLSNPNLAINKTPNKGTINNFNQSVNNKKAQPQQKAVPVKNNLDIDNDIPSNRLKQQNTFAIIVANEDYQHESKVDYAKNDGETFKKYCNKTLGIPEKNIHYIPNATLNNLIGELDWLQQVCDAYSGDASVIFYYAGHGIPDESSGSAYLLPVDGNSRILRTCFSIEELYGILGKLLAKKVTVLMDACFSGAVRSGGMLAAARGVAIKAKTAIPVGNMIVLSAAQGNETAYKYEEARHGLFTYFLLKKLNETKGNVTMGDLSRYITEQVKRCSIVENGKSQTPSVMFSNPLRETWQSLKLY